MRNFIRFTLLVTISFNAVAQTKMETFFKHTDMFMKKYVSAGKVNYAGVKSNKTMIEALSKEIYDMHTGSAPNARAKAFFINAYNLMVIKDISHRVGLKSVMDVPGFFDKKSHKIAGMYITFNELEKQKLMAVYKDPRLHFALVCGAKGCPLLISQGYRPETLKKQLNDVTTATLNSTKFVKVDEAATKVTVSKIFEWYKADFDKGDIIGYINKYRKEGTTIPADFTVEYMDYDWSLNKQ